MAAVRFAHGAFIPSLEEWPFCCPPDRPPPVTVTVEGKPQGKGRARAFVRGGKIGHYTPENTRTYEGLVRAAALDAVANIPQWRPLAVPCSLVLRAVFGIPRSWSQKKRTSALLGAIKPGSRPDLDNIAKAVKDGLKGVVYLDDSLIVSAVLEKRYGTSPLMVVTVRTA